MTPTIFTVGLTRRYRGQAALDDVTLDIEQGSITGLLGRNGASKSTFMRVVTAQEFSTSGIVRVFGEDPVENDAVLRRMVFVREDQQFPDFKVRHAVRTASDRGTSAPDKLLLRYCCSVAVLVAAFSRARCARG
jgi:ABC-2 type transport system ATP-binding protein